MKYSSARMPCLAGSDHAKSCLAEPSPTRPSRAVSFDKLDR
jgi:hypothetical protein